MLIERNKFKQQCTQVCWSLLSIISIAWWYSQAIRQWDQALRERNDYRDALAKVQRQHEEAVKEINQAMAVRIKASKDIKRLTEERNAAMQEYALIMSERDSVHKEIEKLQDEVSSTNTKMKQVENSSKKQDEEKRKYLCQVELLKREIEAALVDRDKAIKEAHELREKVGEREKSSLESSSQDLAQRKDLNHSRTDLEKQSKERSVWQFDISSIYWLPSIFLEIHFQTIIKPFSPPTTGVRGPRWRTSTRPWQRSRGWGRMGRSCTASYQVIHLNLPNMNITSSYLKYFCSSSRKCERL